MLTAEKLSRYLTSRSAAIMMIAAAALYTLLSWWLGEGAGPIEPCRGPALPAACDWIPDPLAARLTNIALNLGIIVLMVVFNRVYNVLRSTTYLYAGLFALMQCATPTLVLNLNTGTQLAIVALLCAMLLYGCFGFPDHPKVVRTVFLVFFLLSLNASTSYCFVAYLPVFLIVCWQMRILTFRALLAAGMGVVTPWILMLGSGLAEVSQLRLPDVMGVFDRSFTIIFPSMFMAATAGATFFMLIVAMILNVFKTIAYNARARSYNGALAILALSTALVMAVDRADMTTYLPLLNVCAAFQVTHYFSAHHYDRRYLGILSVVGVYLLLYLWRLII